MVSNSFRSIALALVIALVGGFQGRWSSLGRSMLRIGSRDRLEMANAFTSPSVITRQKRDEVMNDPFDSPSALINGGSGTVESAVDVSKSPSVTMLARAGTEDVDAMASPAVTFLGIDQDKIKNAMTSPSLQTTAESKTKQDMPLQLVVGMENIKTALIMLAVNPTIGGVVIAGGKGTGKSVMARALHRVMPPIERVKGNLYNIDPENPKELDDFTRMELEESGKTVADMETEIITCPFVQVPVNVMEDRLFGSVDVKKTLETGDTVFEPGLLADAHRGILYVDDLNLLDTDLTTMLLQAISDGFVVVEREGISVKYPCKPLMIGTMNSEDSELKDVFLDRIGIALNADTEPLTLEDRVEAVEKVVKFSSGGMTAEEMQVLEEGEDNLRNSIIFAREYLKDKALSGDQLRYLCEEAMRGGCEGHRAELAATRVALASAALEDSVVRADDLRLAVKLAIVPRSIYRLPEEDEEMMPPPPPPPKSAPQPENQMNEDNTNEEQEEEDDKEDDKEDEEPPEEDEDDEEEMGEPSVPEEFMFEAEPQDVDSDLMKFTGKQRAGKGGKSGVILSRDRGRYLRPVTPKEGQPIRVAIDATLREAAKNQVWRRAEAKAKGLDPTRTYLEPSDVRSKLMARKAGSLLIFAVDASGSMALNRMNAAKGAACGLLTEAYQSRDKISLIPFQGDVAEVLLPPTRSISLAKSRLDTMPCGGGSPLAHAMTQAVRTGLNAMSSGDVGKCIIVLISDGRANVPLAISTGEQLPDSGLDEEGNKKKLTDAEKKEMRQNLKDEVLQIAGQIREMPQFKLLVIDTENKFVSTGMAKEIAETAGGRYHYIPKASADAMKQVTSEAVASLKSESKVRV